MHPCSIVESTSWKYSRNYFQWNAVLQTEYITNNITQCLFSYKTHNIFN